MTPLNDLVSDYVGEVDLFTQVLWTNSEIYKQNEFRALPKWFKEIMRKRAEGLIKLAYSVDYPWVVFPEYVHNYTLIVFKKENEISIQKIKRLQMRYFENFATPKADDFAKVATSIYKGEVLKKHQKTVIKLEDEVFLIFSFPTAMLKNVLQILTASE